MAERRMFAKTIIDSDAFLDMPLSTQALYFHLCMRADDEGFVNSPKKIQRMVGCTDDDARILISKKFIIPFDSGVVVIKHWRIHNYIRADRLNPTNYEEERKLLSVKNNGAYSFCQSDVSQMSVTCQSDVSIGQARQGQVRLGKVRQGESKEETPTLDDISDFIKAEGIDVVPERFFNYYTARGWEINGDPVRDWKALLRSWAPKKEEAHTNEKAEQKLDQLRNYRQALIDSGASSEEIKAVELDICSIEDSIGRAS